jgi:PAS domain S-box-containing protein
MMTARKLSYEEIESKLLEVQELIGALRNHEIDAIVGEEHIAVVRLREVEEALEKARAELEQRVVERTADLARINRQLQDIVAEQQRTRGMLEEGERQYRELVECANSIIMRRDTEGRITFFNEFAQKFFGFDEPDILGRNVVGTIVPETDSTGTNRAALADEVRRQPDDYPAVEAESICRDGRRVWISWTHKPIRDENRCTVGILSVGNDITPLKKAEAALKESERRLLKAQQISHLGNWEWDPGSGALWWSDEACRLFGVEPGQSTLSHETFLSLVHPEDIERVREAVREALERKQPYTAEFRIVRPDGQERFIRSETELAFDAEGQVVRVMGTTQDVTERTRARQQLEQYTSQLRDQAELLDLARDMIFVHDMDGRIVFWNHGAELAYGWKREEALGQLSYRLLQTEYSQPLIRITAKIIHQGWWEGELVHTTRDGRKLTVATRWALRRDPSSRPVAILEIDTDVTERRHAEQEMAEARRFAESIVETIQESLVVLDRQLKVVSANRVFHETFGTTPQQVEGRLFYTLNNGQWDIPQLQSKLREILPHNTSFEGFEVDCDGSDPRSYVLSARPVHQQTRGTEMILLVIQDITVSKKQQRQIEADRQQLESLAQELLMIEERQRRQIATTLHDSIGQSLVFAKRELSVLLQKATSERQDSLRQICEQVADAIKQTRDLTFELSPSTLYTFGLQAAVEELAEQFSECEGFACRVECAQERMLLGEQMEAMLYRAIRELLVNVAKHAGAGSVMITLARNERVVTITVQDDGKGFDTAVLNGHSRECGFGLFSIRERLTRVGGKFSVESTAGHGTKITLMAPLALGQQADRRF